MKRRVEHYLDFFQIDPIRQKAQITFWRRPKESLLDELDSQAEEIDMFSSVRRGSDPFQAKF